MWKTVTKKKNKNPKMECIDEVREINAVLKSVNWEPIGTGEITVDSAAEESVCPKEWGKAYMMREPEKWLKFTNASNGRMGHYGAKDATFMTGDDKTIMSLGFQVSDVQKPLAAVWRIAEKGNIVQFGPRSEDNFIRNVKTDKKVKMVRKGGSYVIEAEFVTSSDFPRQA
jgi:copper chaperone CopZ